MTETTGTCRFCRQDLLKVYPNAPYHLQWAHTSWEAAQKCARPDGEWPTPDRE